jgi:hypothetical protein
MICTPQPILFGLRKIKIMRWGGGNVSLLGYIRGTYRVLVRGEPTERGHLEEPNINGNDNIKMDHQEVGWEHGLD